MKYVVKPAMGVIPPLGRQKIELTREPEVFLIIKLQESGAKRQNNRSILS
jgi:hypothetical protein